MEDLTNYWAVADGIAGTDTSLMCFWPLAEVRPASQFLGGGPTTTPSSELLLFADFMIRSHDFAVEKRADGTLGSVFIVSGDHLQFVTDSMSAFLQLYLIAPETVASGGRGNQVTKKAWLRAILDRAVTEWSTRTFDELTTLQYPAVFVHGRSDDDAFFQVEVTVLERDSKMIHLAILVDDGGASLSPGSRQFESCASDQ